MEVENKKVDITPIVASVIVIGAMIFEIMSAYVGFTGVWVGWLVDGYYREKLGTSKSITAGLIAGFATFGVLYPLFSITVWETWK